MNEGVDAGAWGDDRKFATEGMGGGKWGCAKSEKESIGFVVNPFTIAH
jgi:hypothetical protein